MTTAQSAPKTRNGTARPSAQRTIPVRRLDVDMNSVEINRWIVPEDPIFSNLLATLSAVFPRGEDFFVATVRANKDAVGDDEILKAQVKAFIGQEAMHGREHRRINVVLDEQGYRTARAERGIDAILNMLIKLKPKTLPLAVTAAAEHLTGIFAESALGSAATRETLFSHPEIQSLITWHALEELEHKNVAFDVLEKSNSGYVIRVGGFAITIVVLGGYVVFETARCVFNDRRSLTPARYLKHLRNIPRQNLISPWSVRQLVKYVRPGFHPDDIETDYLIEEWRTVLSEKTTITAGVGKTRDKSNPTG
ncbi:MAG: metal-dependent hydrolase [Microthrixaceae bacterium]|nr:metal-dependent hydrolase [Microthrixaceae bacterium]